MKSDELKGPQTEQEQMIYAYEARIVDMEIELNQTSARLKEAEAERDSLLSAFKDNPSGRNLWRFWADKARALAGKLSVVNKRLAEVTEERNDLARTVEAYEEMAAKMRQDGGPNVLRRQMERRRLQVSAEIAEAKLATVREDTLREAVDTCTAIIDKTTGLHMQQGAFAAKKAILALIDQSVTKTFTESFKQTVSLYDDLPSGNQADYERSRDRGKAVKPEPGAPAGGYPGKE